MTMCRSRPSTLSAATYAVIITATAATAGVAFVAALFLLSLAHRVCRSAYSVAGDETVRRNSPRTRRGCGLHHFCTGRTAALSLRCCYQR